MKNRKLNRSKRLQFKCPICSKISIRRQDKIKEQPNWCRICSRFIGAAKRNQNGENNPGWLGGFKYWQKGRLGKDKNGLSWKTQRKLVWKRDDYRCRLCDRKYVNRNPDCHHIIPYRISKSHALNNLICLCKKCHKIVENKFLI